MHKLLYFIIFLLIPTVAFGQEFLYNPDFIYGEGRGATLEEADKKAFEGLVTSLSVDVRVNTSLGLNDHNGDLNRLYDANINTQSSISLRGTRQYIDESYTDGYRVFRYFNATEYVQTRKERALAYLELAKENYYGSAHKGTINLTLGYYYLAYCELNDDVLSFLDSDNQVEKARIINHIKNVIKSFNIKFRPASFYEFDWSDINAKTTRPSFDPDNLHVSVYYRGELMHYFDFEYWDGAKWSDDYVWNSIGMIAEIKCTTNVPRNIRDLKYRIVFQTVDEEGNKINLPVPEEFYFVKIVEFVNPRKWLDDDIKKGWYTE